MATGVVCVPGGGGGVGVADQRDAVADRALTKEPRGSRLQLFVSLGNLVLEAHWMGKAGRARVDWSERPGGGLRSRADPLRVVVNDDSRKHGWAAELALPSYFTRQVWWLVIHYTITSLVTSLVTSISLVTG